MGDPFEMYLYCLTFDQSLLMKRTFSLLFVALSLYSAAVDAQTRRIMTFAGAGGIGGFAGDGYAATACLLDGPEAVALDGIGNAYIVDYYNNRIRKVKTDGTVVTFAGSGTPGIGGDGASAPSAQLDPSGVAVDPRGNVYISDAIHGVIRKVNKLGIISRYAGTGAWGYTGDNGAAVSARLTSPTGLATDRFSNLYIADAGNHVIRKIDTFGVITTVAGNGTAGYSGDGLPAVTAELDSPVAVAVDGGGSLYVADRNNNVIRLVDVTHTIYTIAGSGTQGYSGDGGLAISASLYFPTGVAVDTGLNVYIADSYNNVVRMVTNLGYISTLAGNGTPGFGGDLGAANGANLYHPSGVTTDTFGNVYIADADNQRVRKVYNYYTVGVNNINATALSVYPNPFVDEVTVTGVSKNDKVAVYDLAGRLVAPVIDVTIDGTETLKIAQLAKGTYMMQITDATGAKKAIVKLVK